MAQDPGKRGHRAFDAAVGLDPTVSGLCALAARQGWSVRSLARCAGLSHSTVSRFFRGKIRPTPRIVTALGRCLGPAGRGGPGPGGAGRARPFCRPGAGVPLPEDVTEADLLTALDGLTAMAAGPEVPAMIRVGFEDKRARLEEMGLTGSMLARLDGLYGLYMDGASDALRSGLRARIGACLLYFILSADRVPDDLLPIGYLDDAWVVDRVWGESQAAGFVPPLGGGDGDPEENPGPCLPAQGTGVVVRGPGSPSVRGSRARPSSGQGPGEDPQDGPALSGTDPHTPRGKRPCPDA